MSRFGISEWLFVAAHLALLIMLLIRRSTHDESGSSASRREDPLHFSLLIYPYMGTGAMAAFEQLARRVSLSPEWPETNYLAVYLLLLAWMVVFEWIRARMRSRKTPTDPSCP